MNLLKKYIELFSYTISTPIIVLMWYLSLIILKSPNISIDYARTVAIIYFPIMFIFLIAIGIIFYKKKKNKKRTNIIITPKTSKFIIIEFLSTIMPFNIFLYNFFINTFDENFNINNNILILILLVILILAIIIIWPIIIISSQKNIQEENS